jgi:2-polyprenyl-3-methyl-5-hydroxy-6-metoxy-1,4-benzoquinol methylase
MVHQSASRRLNQKSLDREASPAIDASMTLANLHTRHLEPELMDQPGLEPDLHAHALSGLKRLNRFSRSSAILWRPLHALYKQRGEQAGTQSAKPLRVLDIASGGGDVVLNLAQQAARHGLPIEFQGCDISPFSVRYANEQSNLLNEPLNGSKVSFTLLNAISEPLPTGFDIIMCSLFLHHLSKADALTLLRKMAQAAQHMVLINDLRRTRLGYALAQLACRSLTRSRIVHIDGPLSVAAAFTGDEALALAAEAGLESADLTYHFPQRFLLSWRRSS